MSDVPRTRRSLLTRLFTAPLSPQALEHRAKSRLRTVFGWTAALIPALFIAALASAVGDAWKRRPVDLEPRHRPEAICFALAAPPAFAPPMRVEPSVAIVRRQFPQSTPPAVALQQAMRFSDEMLLSAGTRRVGDFEVADLWLRITGRGAPEYWLIVCWMNGDDLEVCNFRFAGDEPVLTDTQRKWGARLLSRMLTEANFREGALPKARLRLHDGATMPVFGPEA
jgi:hypothetical protein